MIKIMVGINLVSVIETFLVFIILNNCVIFRIVIENRYMVQLYINELGMVLS